MAFLFGGARARRRHAPVHHRTGRARLCADFTLTVWRYRELIERSTSHSPLYEQSLLTAQRDSYLAGGALLLLL